MKIKEMRIRDVLVSRVKKIIIEVTSLKFWGILFLAYLNAHLVFESKKFDMFGMSAFLLAIGIREAADIFQQKAKPEGGEPK